MDKDLPRVRCQKVICGKIMKNILDKVKLTHLDREDPPPPFKKKIYFTMEMEVSVSSLT